MFIILAFASIVVITGLAWVVRQQLRWAFICPICVGVSATWLWLLGAYYFGYAVDLTLVSLLMGGSVVGIAYTSEKRLTPGKNGLLWKALFIPAGFGLVYSLLIEQWVAMAAALVVIVALLLIFFLVGRGPIEATSDAAVLLEEKMKQCC